MASNSEIIDRIQKYEGVEKFAILNENGINQINSENKESDKKGANFSDDLRDIPALVKKTVSTVRDIDPMVKW